MIITPGLRSGSGSWEDISPVIRMTLISFAEQYEKSDLDRIKQSQESDKLRSELESMRKDLKSAHYSIEKLSSDRASLESELRKIRRNESNLLDQITLKELTSPSLDKDRTEQDDIRKILDTIQVHHQDLKNQVQNSNVDIDNRIQNIETKISDILLNQVKKQSIASALHKKATREELSDGLLKVENSLKSYVNQIGQSSSSSQSSSKPPPSPPTPSTPIKTTPKAKTTSSSNKKQQQPLSLSSQEQQKQQPSLSHEVFREIAIRRLEYLEETIHNLTFETNQQIDELANRIDFYDNNDNDTGWLTRRSPIFFEYSVRFKELEEKVSFLEPLTNLTASIESRLDSLVVEVQGLEEKQDESEEQDREMKKEINQIVSNLSDFQMTSLTSLSQLETILPQMEILSSLNHTVSQLTSSMENVKETNSLLTSRAQTIDEVVLGKHHNNLYHDNLHNCYNDDPSSLLIKQQQQQHHHHQQQQQQPHQQYVDIGGPNGFNGLVQLQSKFPTVVEDIIWLKSEITKVAKFAGNIEKRHQETDTTCSFLDQRLETIGEVTSTLSNRFTSFSQESEASDREMKNKLDVLTKSIFKCIEEEERTGRLFIGTKNRFTNLESLIKSLIDIRSNDNKHTKSYTQTSSSSSPPPASPPPPPIRHHNDHPHQNQNYNHSILHQYEQQCNEIGGRDHLQHQHLQHQQLQHNVEYQPFDQKYNMSTVNTMLSPTDEEGEASRRRRYELAKKVLNA